jgi:hypothetical protein
MEVRSGRAGRWEAGRRQAGVPPDELDRDSLGGGERRRDGNGGQSDLEGGKRGEEKEGNVRIKWGVSVLLPGFNGLITCENAKTRKREDAKKQKA